MRNSRALSNDDLICSSPRQLISPHPPSVPCNGKNEAVVKIRQRRYRNQSSEKGINDQNLDSREIRSAGSNSFMKVKSLQSEENIAKTKICSAPGPRSRTSEYRSSNFKREKSAGLYTFDSIPSLIQDYDVQILPRTKRSEQNCNDKSIPSMVVQSPEHDLAPIIISRSIKPCKSQASPVTSDNHRSLILVKRESLKQLSNERMSQIIRKSMQNTSEMNSSICCLSSLENVGNEPINLNHYRPPSDASESFEANMLASLVKISAQSENVNNSKNFTDHVTPRTEALIGGSYSDEESSVTTTGPLTNRLGIVSKTNIIDQHGMHNEWKRLCNTSQDTCRSTDFFSTINDSYCHSITTDDNSCCDTNISGSKRDGYILVHYLSDLDCFIDPKTGICYESSL